MRTTSPKNLSTSTAPKSRPFFSKPGNKSNQAEKPFFGPSTIQPKLTIGQPGDTYEQEADAMADQVMRMSEAPGNDGETIQAKPQSVLQRKCTSCEEEAVQTKPLMMKSEGNSLEATAALSSQLNTSKGSGAPLGESTNNFMNTAFGTDFSKVRVHTGQNAIQMNQGLHARAFTNGSDIYFNKGEYAPGTADGKRLLAHELTHVVQQGDQLSDRVQLQGEPLEDREEDVGFTHTSTYEDFESEVRRWVAGRVLSRTAEAHRERTLIPSGSLRGYYNLVSPGQPINIHAYFHSNGFSFRRLTLSIGGETIEIRIRQSDPESDRPSPPENTSEGFEEGTVPDIEDPRQNPSFSDAVLPGIGGLLAIGRVGTVLAGTAGAAAEAILAPIALMYGIFNMGWAVGNIYRSIEGQRASGMATVDFAWTLASRVFGNSSDSPHQRAISYAQSMDEFNGRGDVYREPLLVTRENVNRVWSSWSEQDRIQLRAAFSNIDELASHLLDQLKPKLNAPVTTYATSWHNRWRDRRDLYR